MKYFEEQQALYSVVFQDPEVRVKQLKFIIVFLLAMMGLLIINNIVFFNKTMPLDLIVAMIILSLLYIFLSSDTTNIVAGMLLWSLTILASHQAWLSNGLHGTEIIAFPSLMILAHILSGRFLFYSLAVYMLSVFYFFAYAEQIGFIEVFTVSTESPYKKANILSIIIIVSALGIRITTENIKVLVIRLTAIVKKYEKLQIEMKNLVLFDALTGLPNEIQCSNDLNAILESSQKSNGINGFIILEITNFEWIHSSLGQKSANKIICYLTERLHILESDQVHLYRSSSNEFIYTIQASDYEDVSEFCQQIIQAIARPFPVESFDIEMSSAVGVSILSVDGDNYESLKQKAHAALILAKNSEPNSFHFFEMEMESYINNRVKMVQELKKAIVLDEFELFYQAKVSMKDQSVIGAEALIRWIKPGVGIVSPLDFIPIAEESGLINEIGKWALEQACHDCKGWHAVGLTHLSVAVNLSPVQFQRGNLPNIVFRALHEADLSPKFLELEITESLFIDDSLFIKDQVYQISTKGIDIAIDDFGTGYSNLNYLTKFYASILKVDMSFIRGMENSEQGESLVSAIIKMSQMMKLKNVAEGIEDLETYEKLKDMGCRYGQGYYWCKPLPNEEFIKKVAGWKPPG